MKMRIAPLWLALAGVCLAWIPPAGAQMANDLTIGNPKAMALGNAVTADETGIDSVHYNPAALTRMKGRQATVKLLTGVMDIRAGFRRRRTTAKAPSACATTRSPTATAGP